MFADLAVAGLEGLGRRGVAPARSHRSELLHQVEYVFPEVGHAHLGHTSQVLCSHSPLLLWMIGGVREQRPSDFKKLIRAHDLHERAQYAQQYGLHHIAAETPQRRRRQGPWTTVMGTPSSCPATALNSTEASSEKPTTISRGSPRRETKSRNGMLEKADGRSR